MFSTFASTFSPRTSSCTPCFRILARREYCSWWSIFVSSSFTFCSSVLMTLSFYINCAAIRSILVDRMSSLSTIYFGKRCSRSFLSILLSLSISITRSTMSVSGSSVVALAVRCLGGILPRHAVFINKRRL